MDNSRELARTTVAALLALGLVGAVGPVAAADAEIEKCYGVAKAGKNDCQTATSSCAGTAAQDGQPDAWLAVPKGTCDKIAGGSLVPAKS